MKEFKFIIQSSGDPSVGINGGHAEVTMELDESDREYIAFVKSTLMDAFADVWDDRTARVYTSEELAEFERCEEKEG